eukprot:5322753-Amphidinium_carterae.2
MGSGALNAINHAERRARPITIGATRCYVNAPTIAGCMPRPCESSVHTFATIGHEIEVKIEASPDRGPLKHEHRESEQLFKTSQLPVFKIKEIGGIQFEACQKKRNWSPAKCHNVRRELQFVGLGN